MMTRSYLVKLVAGASDSSKVWNSRKPMNVGHPIRWVMEQEETGVRVRNLQDASADQFLKYSEIEKTASIILGTDTAKSSSFKLELRPVGTVVAASSAENTVGNSLRIFYCKDSWTVDSAELTKSYIARIDGKKVFKMSGNPSGIYTKNDLLEITALVSGVVFNAEMKKGETRRLPFSEAVGTVVSFADSSWKLASFEKDTSTNPFATPLTMDSEAQLFKKTLQGAMAAMLVVGLISWFVPTAPVAKTEQKVRILLTAKKKTVKGYMTAAPTGDPKASDLSVGQKGVAKNAGKKGTRVAANKKVAPSGKHIAKQKIAKKQAKSSASARVAKNSKKSTRQNRPVAKAKPAPVQHSELFKTLASSSVRKSARSLVSGSVSGNGKGSSASVAEARSLGTSSGSGRGALGGAGGVATRSAAVSGFGGGGLGDGDGGPGSAGAGYGRGSYSKVSGQGRSFVSLDSGASDVDEGLTREQVGRVIHSHMNEIRYCYESAVLRTPDVAGRMTVKFSINAPGDVQTAGVGASNVGDQRLHNCIVSHLKGWKFPKPRGGVVVAVAYPFMFKTLTR